MIYTCEPFFAKHFNIALDQYLSLCLTIACLFMKDIQFLEAFMSLIPVK